MSSSLRSMSTASSPLSSLSTYVPLAGGKKGVSQILMRILVGAAIAYAIFLIVKAAKFRMEGKSIGDHLRDMGLPLDDDQLGLLLVAIGASVAVAV